MLNLGLSKEAQDALLQTLVESHEIRVQVDILDKNEKPLTSLTAPADKLIDGSVQVDSTADVSRSLQLSIIDPTHKLTFDSTNPAQGSMYADNFIAVRYEVYVPALEEWVSIPVFQGVLTKFDRNGHIVNIEGQGKESLMLAPHFATFAYTIAKGTRLDNAVKAVARRVGERLFSIPAMSFKLRRARSVLPGSEPWRVITGGDKDAKGRNMPGLMSKAGNRFAFYNGRGQLAVKARNASPVYTFDYDNIINSPTLSYDTLEFVNTVVVRGGVPKGAQNHVVGRASLPGTHPLSPSALSRNGAHRYMTLLVDADNLKTKAGCERHAKRILDASAYEGISASFECLPVPMLEENDIVVLSTPWYTVQFPAKQFTIPLTSGSSMSVGVNKRIKRSR